MVLNNMSNWFFLQFPLAFLPVQKCDDNVNVSATMSSSQSGCSSFEIEWEAMDHCGKTSSVTQKVSFSDKTPPMLVDDAPPATTLSCGQSLPQEVWLTFSDNCGEVRRAMI